MVLVDDKVDNVVAVAVNVQVVNGDVVAAVAVDVTGVAVGDDAAGVGLADAETGLGAVEDLMIRRNVRYCILRKSMAGYSFTYAVVHAGASVVRQVGDMGWVSEDGNGNDC